MQKLENLDLTPNHTLKRLINSWQWSNSQRDDPRSSSPASSSGRKPADPKDVVDILRSIESSPFKVSALKKLRGVIGPEEENFELFVRCGGIEILSGLLCQGRSEHFGESFAALRSCEESLSILHGLPLSTISGSQVQFLTRPDCVRSLVWMIQTGNTESRLHAVSILRKITNKGFDWCQIGGDQEVDIFKALLELLSDEICNEATSSALDILLDLLPVSRLNRIKAIEAGAVCILIELLPDSSRGRCEKMMAAVKQLCETAEGRSAFVDHAMAVAVVTKKIMRVSELTTRLGVKILWLICGCYPTKRFLEQMAEYGALSKLCALLQINGGSDGSSTRERAMKMLKMHRNTWKRHPCFPVQLQDFFRRKHGSQ
uniref:U-box domain-containing protein n=2 Tax=Nymphaea colorata TaxID=210225 RepID=A0A5K0YUK2_9MAGN|nr:unnamed protein product [Nymphaea colorata]